MATKLKNWKSLLLSFFWLGSVILLFVFTLLLWSLLDALTRDNVPASFSMLFYNRLHYLSSTPNLPTRQLKQLPCYSVPFIILMLHKYINIYEFRAHELYVSKQYEKSLWLIQKSMFKLELTDIIIDSKFFSLLAYLW